MGKKANIDIAVMILAGGMARRLGGGDKSLSEIGGKPILRHILDRLGGDYPIALNANERDGVAAAGRFGDFGLPIFGDIDGIPESSGPLAGILSGMGFFASYDVLVVVAGDVPFIPIDLADRFMGVYGAGGIDVVFAESYGRRHPVVSLWDIGLRDDLAEALVGGVRKIEDFSDNYAVGVVDFSLADGFDMFFNVNYAEDIARAQKILEKEKKSPSGRTFRR